MALYISVVNHNHDHMICANPTLMKLATDHTVIIKSNTLASKKLKDYCLSSSIHLIQGENKRGFGSNNNEVFLYAEQNLNMTLSDHFLVLNPDVEIKTSTINLLLEQIITEESPISTINLFKNREMTKYDNSIRYFPNLLNPIKSLLGVNRTDYYDKSKIKSPIVIDWAAGSFLLFQCDIFKRLNGFDEKYFMYFEDVDICRRAKETDVSVTYYPMFHAIHLAQHSNRNVFSTTFYHYLKSTVIYFTKLRY